jgi:hypothetical protein
MQKILLITIFLISSLSADIGLGTILENNTGAFSFSSNVTFLPKKPSSGESMESFRFINATLLMSSGLEFLYGKNAHGEDNYLGLNYYIPIENYTLSFNFKKKYDDSILLRPKEIGATLSWKVSKQLIIPYLKYTLISHTLSQLTVEPNSNFELLTFGGYVPYGNFIISFSYSLPFNGFAGYYNSKGNINISAGLYLE